jgi:hypothetical protein
MSDRRHTEERRTGERLEGRERRNRNRRAFPRWPAEFEVRFKNSGKTVIGTPIEIGENGLSMLVEEFPPQDVEFDLDFRLEPADEWVAVKVMVRHIAEGRCGVEFLNLKRTDRLKIIDYVYKGRKV